MIDTKELRIYQRQLNETEDERDTLRAELNEIRYGVAVAHDTIKALCAKIEQMERQEPECEVVGQIRNVVYEVRTLKYDLHPGMKLYAIPGAQPAPSLASGDVSLISEGKTQPTPSVPDGWKLVPIDPTLSMLTAAILSSHAINVHRAEHCYRAMLAAAPEAKP